MAEQNLQNDASGNRDQHVVAAGLHPVVAARWWAQAMLMPVIDHIDPAPELRWQSVAAVKPMVGAGATFIVPRLFIPSWPLLLAL